ncbi:MAG UNVERIFIED_CONTAM: hypothetical protein LVR18_09900 [Planctomycetaceae bacterium]
MSMTDDERDIWSWQLDVEGFGEAGQQRLKSATVLISRVGAWAQRRPTNWRPRALVA